MKVKETAQKRFKEAKLKAPERNRGRVVNGYQQEMRKISLLFFYSVDISEHRLGTRLFISCSIWIEERNTFMSKNC